MQMFIILIGYYCVDSVEYVEVYIFCFNGLGDLMCIYIVQVDVCVESGVVLLVFVFLIIILIICGMIIGFLFDESEDDSLLMVDF